jgi:hypothetical protein
MPSYNPGRPPSYQDLNLNLHGDPQPLGILTSSGSTVPVNNVTTATPFKTGNLLADGVSRSLLGSLSGRVLLVAATAAGVLLTSSSPQISVSTVTTVALWTTIPPLANTFPGVLINTNEIKDLTMLPGSGWLQWLSNSGSASLIVWELV